MLRVELTPDRKRATGVTYVNSAGEEFFQPAEMVILSAYVLQNVRLLLLSGIGKPYDPKTGEGVVGKNYAYQTMSSVNVFFDDKIMNPFIGAGALATVIDDFNGDNFDHCRLGLHRRRLHRGHGHRRASDRNDLHAAGHAGLGPRVEARGREELFALIFPQRSRLLHERTAATTWTWIPPTGTSTAGRCCA